jgi:hypothetical protein
MGKCGIYVNYRGIRMPKPCQIEGKGAFSPIGRWQEDAFVEASHRQTNDPGLSGDRVLTGLLLQY